MPILVVGLFAELYKNFSLGAELVGLFLWKMKMIFESCGE